MKHSLRAFGFTLIALWLMSSAASAGTLRLAWDATATATGYVISYGLQPQSYTASVDVGAVTTYTLPGLPDGQRYYVVVQAYNSSRLLSGYSAEVNGYTSTIVIAPTAPRTPTDIDGDGHADVAVWRGNAGFWYLLRSSSSYSPASSQAIQWGGAWVGDVPVAADYDGDGFMDIAVYRPGPLSMWYILRSSMGYDTGSYTSAQWGGAGDIPVPADYDGDGKADLAVWRPSTAIWYVRASGGAAFNLAIQWGGGAEGDIPVPGDYDGDGKADIAVWRPSTGTWYILTSSSGYTNYISKSWGGGWVGDLPVAADFDGDHRMDIAVWRPSSGMWYILTSSSSFNNSVSYQWGGNGDKPVLNDYDADGKVDLTVWRPSTGMWYIRTSGSGYTTYMSVSYGAGSAGDTPIGQLQVQR